jgi:hypothetical protein
MLPSSGRIVSLEEALRVLKVMWTEISTALLVFCHAGREFGQSRSIFRRAIDLERSLSGHATGVI